MDAYYVAFEKLYAIGAFLLLVQGVSEILKTYYAFVKGRWP